MFLHNRVSVYEWDWEQFLSEYQVLDAFFAVARDEFGVTARDHPDRIKALSNRCGLYSIPSLVRRIVDLRTDLVHEALWGGQMPGTAPKTDLVEIRLRQLNQRIGIALLGINTDYISTSWKSLSSCAFSLK